MLSGFVAIAVPFADAISADDAVPGTIAFADTEHLCDDPQHTVHRDREADALGAGPDRHVDADQLAVDVQYRAARVDWIDAGIGLDEGLVRNPLVKRHVALV